MISCSRRKRCRAARTSGSPLQPRPRRSTRRQRSDRESNGHDRRLWRFPCRDHRPASEPIPQTAAATDSRGDHVFGRPRRGVGSARGQATGPDLYGRPSRLCAFTCQRSTAQRGHPRWDPRLIPLRRLRASDRRADSRIDAGGAGSLASHDRSDLADRALRAAAARERRLPGELAAAAVARGEKEVAIARPKIEGAVRKGNQALHDDVLPRVAAGASRGRAWVACAKARRAVATAPNAVPPRPADLPTAGESHRLAAAQTSAIVEVEQGAAREVLASEMDDLRAAANPIRHPA